MGGDIRPRTAKGSGGHGHQKRSRNSGYPRASTYYGQLVLMYRYIKCYTKIRSIKSFTRTTRLTQHSQPFVLLLPINRMTHYRDSSFFKLRALETIYQQRSLPLRLIFPILNQKHKHTTPFFLLPLSITLPDHYLVYA